MEEKKYYTNILSNGDLFRGYITFGNKKYKQYIEKETRLPYIIDAFTDNISFLRTANDLATLGIRNYHFMLKLYDPNLLDVNPYDLTLQPDIVKRILVECKRNIWYFLRVVARIPVEGGAIGPGAGMRYQLNRGNLASTWCFVNNIDHYQILPRQIGKTKSAIENILWAYIFSSNTKMMMLCKDAPGSKTNLKTLKEQRDLLPVYMQCKIIINSDGEKKTAKGDNATYLLNPHNGNQITTATGGASEEAADRCGRGLTQAIQMFDEVEFTSHIGTILDASGPAYLTASRNAEANGAPHCKILLSTPGNLDSEPVISTNDLRRQTMRFSEGFYDRCISEVKDIIHINSPVNIVYIEFSYKQLGKDEKWFINACAGVSNNKTKIRREILLKRIRGASLSPFEPEDLEEIGNYQQDPIEEIYIEDVYPLYVYEKLNKNIPYIIGVDVAAGRYGDNSAITILDPYSVRPVAEFKSNITTTHKLKALLMHIIMRYIPKSILVIENNNMGSSVIDDLRVTPIAPNLYYDSNKYFIPSSTQKLDAKGFAVLEAKNAKTFGLNTNAKTRETMINLLFERVKEYKSDFVTRNIISDLNSLVRTPSGKIQAVSGAHDDSIMSYLIALFTYTFGSNLQRYGFTKGDVAPEPEKQKTRQEYFEELPEDVKAYFGDVANMKTSEEYENEMLMKYTLERSHMRTAKNETGGSSRNIDLETDIDTGIQFEKEDLSWLDELNK